MFQKNHLNNPVYCLVAKNRCSSMIISYVAKLLVTKATVGYKQYELKHCNSM